MKTILSFIINLALITGFTTLAQANEKGLAWKKSQLENQLTTQSHQALSALLDNDQYIITTNVILLTELETNQIYTETKPADKKDEELLLISKVGMWATQSKFLSSVESVQRDFFKSIKSISINIFMDETVDKKVQASVRKIVKSITNSYTGIKKTIKVSPMKMLKRESKKTDLAKKESKQPNGLIEWALELKFVLGLLLASALMYFLGMTAIGIYKKIQTQRLEILENQSADSGNQTITMNDNSSDTVTNTPQNEINEDGSVNYYGFDQFSNLIVEQPLQAANIIKDSLNGQSLATQAFIGSLPKMCSTEQLLSLFKYLNEDQKKRLKQLLSSGSSDSADTSLANKYISTRVMENLLGNDLSIEAELKELLSDITFEESLTLAKNNENLGALLANTLSPLQVARLFEELSEEDVQSITKNSLNFDLGDSKKMTQEMQDELDNIRTKNKVIQSPFIEKSLSLIKNLGPEKEMYIFNALIQANDMKGLEKAANEVYPAHLITKLEKDTIKDSLNGIPLAKKAELICTLNDPEKTFILEAVANTEKLQELISFQIDQINSNDIEKRKLLKNKSALWKDFVYQVRRHINNNDGAKDNAETVIEDWIATHADQGGLREVA